MILGLLLIMLAKTLGAKPALSVYAAVSFLSLILVTEKESVLMYVLFFGYYPIIKQYIEKIRPRFLSFAVKLLLFNAALAAVELLCVYVFGIPFFEDNTFSVGMVAAFAVLMNVVFIMYEFMLKYFLILYENKLEKRIKKLLK